MSDLPIVKEIAFTPVSVPLARPMRTASGTLPGAALGLIDVTTNAGITGHAYIFTYTPRMLTAMKALNADIKDLIVGKSIEPAQRFREFQATFRLLGVQGLLGMLIAGIDMALWDALGKCRDEPVCQLMGGAPRPLQAYDSFGFIEPGQDEPMLEQSLKQGFKAIKIKLGVGTFEEDEASVAAVRRAIGPDVSLMIDYNQSLNVATALRYAERLAVYDIAWIEEPVPAEDLAGHKGVRSKSPIPVQTGENWWLPATATLSIAAGASDFIMPDAMKIGGFTGWSAVAGMAEKANLPMSSHAFVEASAHALAATPTAHWLEYLDKARPLLVDAYDVVDGTVTARGPGLGIAWNAKAVAAYAV